MSTAALAAQAYAAQAGQAGALERAAKPPAEDPSSGFADLLGQALDSTKAIGAAVDDGIRAQAAGNAELVDVVTAVAEAELTVQTIVAVRDRVISAYQEILRMPI